VKNIYFVVNNDLNYDQRMIRICNSLVSGDYTIFLVGKSYRSSLPLSEKSFNQHRLYCYFKKGKMAYIEFNFKLFCYLLFQRADCLCAIDLDTIFPVLFVSTIKRCKRIYDAHELFTEMKEIISRPAIKRIWNWVERNAVPYFKSGYTVSESIAQGFLKKYKVDYEVIRNMPKINAGKAPVTSSEKIILYQGAVNYGRCLEYLIPAMKEVPARLLICGDGNFMNQCRQLVIQHQLSEKIIFKGMLLPEELNKITCSSYIGINLVEPYGLNQLYSLANKFFDYIHAALPQLTMDFVEYARINKEYKVAVLIPEPLPGLIASALNLLLENDVLYKELKENCIKAREIYNWQREEQILFRFYDKIFLND
jgi:glycosyltransferase involved in cell wall biosynthesis